MPGFNFFYNLPNITIPRDKSLVCDTISGANFYTNRFTLNKFLDDKIFIEIDNIVIVLEGIIFNKKELLLKHESSSWSQLIFSLYRKNKEFFNEFRGSFSGLVYNRDSDELLAFTDHLGTKHLYYYLDKSDIVISSDISDIYTCLKSYNKELVLNTKSSYDLLSYGYMLGRNTLSDMVCKLSPGTYILIKGEDVSIKEYYKLPLSSNSTNLTEEEILDSLDKKFRIAVRRQFDKDIEYGYRHFVALSGGLDSRMTSWVAHDMGFLNQVNFTFSQSDYLDETIPKKISSDLKHEWIFKSLDNGLFLKDLDEITRITGGNVLYYGIAHGNSMFKLLNFNDLGIIHSGQLGDIVIGSYIKNNDPKSFSKLNGAFSKEMLVNNYESENLSSADVVENKIIYQRGLNGINNSLVAMQKYSETMSPFYDIDFFEFCLSIPIKLRMNHNIYKKWILDKYPIAASYIWESTGKKVGKNEILIRFKGRKFTLSNFISLVFFKIGLRKSALETKNHMNPLDYWYSTNSDIKLFQDKYFNENINKILDDKLRLDCIKLYKEGKAVQKNQVLSLISSAKMFFS